MNGILERARGLMILSDPQVHQLHMPSPDRSAISDASILDGNDSFESQCDSDEMQELVNNKIKKGW
eukprot:13298070-Ditylum_brightwellii.AAC.1